MEFASSVGCFIIKVFFAGGEDKSYFVRASRLAGKVAGSIPAAVEHKRL
jgi:hypothetical protein